MRLKQRIPRVKETIGEVCSECGHAMSNHDWTIDTQDKKYSKVSCRICPCKDGSIL